jgi:hypothetical protein
MARPWTVLNPSALQPVAAGLWCVTDDIPGLKGVNRRMTIVKRRDGGLLFYNAIPLHDAQLRELGSLGKPAQLFLPSHLHAIDAPAFAERLGLATFAPQQGLPVLRERLPSVQASGALPPDEDLTVKTVDGFKTGEGLLLVKRGAETSLLVADLVTNVAHGRGLGGLMMRLVGFTGPRPMLPGPVRLRVGKDLQAVRALLEALARTPGLSRIVTSHGELVTSGAPDALRAVAARL